MKKAVNKFIAGLLAVAMCFGASFAVACTRNKGDLFSSLSSSSSSSSSSSPWIYVPKAHLYISNFNGSVGTEWLYAAKARFEEKHKNTVFIPGTKGVTIQIETHENAGTVVAEKMLTEDNEIYFLEDANYYDMVYAGKLLDITDIVTEDLTDFGENKSIEDKMNWEYVEYFKVSGQKYYGLPHNQVFYPMTYDMDLFDDYHLYFDHSGGLTKTSTDSGRSTGPDGKAGTYDDGLPATYDQMWTLCQTMRTRDVDPFVWSGAYSFYATKFLANLKADFEGTETKLNYTFDGLATKLVDKINSDGTITYKPLMQITEENGYEVYNSAGTYYALSFMEEIVNNKWCVEDSFNKEQFPVDAQNNFLQSRYGVQNPIGMLIDGCWWPNQSAENFEALETVYGQAESLQNRRLAIMPYPKATAGLVGAPMTLLDTSMSVACINANIAEDKKELAKTFLQFLHTDASLVEFLQITNTTRSFQYNLSSKEYDNLCSYAQSVVNIVNNSKVVIPGSSKDVFISNYAKFNVLQAFDISYGFYPHTAFRAGKTLNQVWALTRTKYTQDTWKKLIGA